LSEARGAEKARGGERRKAAVHRAGLWPEEPPLRSRTCLAFGRWLRMPATRQPAAPTASQPSWHRCCSLGGGGARDGQRRVCSLRCADHGVVYGRQARRQDLLLRELRERAYELAALLR